MLLKYYAQIFKTLYIARAGNQTDVGLVVIKLDSKLDHIMRASGESWTPLLIIQC